MSNFETKITGDKELLAALNRLSTKGMKDVIRTTLQRVGGTLQTEAKRNLRQVTSRYNTRSKAAKGSTRGPLQSGITNKVWKNNEGVTVTIMKDYRLKWFEMGTTNRQTSGRVGTRYRKPKSTGQMKTSNFFKRAISSKQQSVKDDINNTLSKEISKRYINK